MPYVNIWGPESVDRISIAHDPYVGGPAIFHDDSNEPEPDFTKAHMGRQRECMVTGRCQVCRRFIPWSRRFLVISSMSVEQIDLAGKPAVVVFEPWLDEYCARIAISICPALIRRSHGEDLQLVPVTRQRDAQIVMSHGWVDGPLEAESRRLMPAMWAKLIVRGVTVTTS